MADKQIIKQLAERYKEMCRSPFADGYTFKAFEGECAKKGFTRDDIKNYIEKEKQERKAKRTKSIKSLKEQLKAKEQECEELKNIINEAKNSKLDLNSFFAIEATIGEYCLELDQLKAKNDELMKQHQADKGLITSTGKQNYQLIQEYDKLKQTLTEIKQIASREAETSRYNGSFTWKQILQKISECEGNDELTK